MLRCLVSRSQSPVSQAILQPPLQLSTGHRPAPLRAPSPDPLVPLSLNRPTAQPPRPRLALLIVLPLALQLIPLSKHPRFHYNSV